MIEFKQVTKSFGDRKVLDQVTFKVARGEIVFIIGKSGVGKSVLLKNIVGLLRPDQGQIWVEKEEVSHLDEQGWFRIRRMCGMVFQNPALLDSLTVFENIAFGLRAHRFYSSEAELEKKVRDMLTLVHLGPEIVSRYPGELSFGMQKRASIARTLVLRPAYVLFDEPTTGLDPIVTYSINQLIQELSHRLRVSSLVVSHDMHCALEIADRILMLHEGRVVMEGTPAQVLKSEVPMVREFLSRC